MRITLPCLLLILLILPERAKAVADPDLPLVVKQIVERTNAFRKEQNLPPVTIDAQLTATSTDFAQFMAETGKYGHDADGKQPHERAEAHRYEYCVVLENIAYHYDSEGTAQEDLIQFFVEGWKNSPGHRKNMLDADITQTGVAVARAENGYYYAVQMFGRPKSAMIQFEVSNPTDRTFEYTLGDEKFTISPRQIRSHGICKALNISVMLPGAKDRKTITPAKNDKLVFRRTAGGYDLAKAK